jgi:signal peptidase I
MNQKPRKWWIAGIMSFLLPGLGQLYNGQPIKGCFFFTIPFISLSGLLLCLNLKSFIWIGLSVYLLIYAFRIVAIIDAIIWAIKQRVNFVLKKYNKILIYLLLFVCIEGIAVFTSINIRAKYIEAYKVPFGSMEPTLQIGDHILVDKRVSLLNPNYGDLIVFQSPDDPETDYVKRVIALGGDTVKIVNKKVFVNGKILTENYTDYIDSKIIPGNLSPRDNFGPITILKNKYFVLGDNRDNSADNRFWGTIDRAKIKGKVLSIYLSIDYKTKKIRWKRFGNLLS